MSSRHKTAVALCFLVILLIACAESSVVTRPSQPSAGVPGETTVIRYTPAVPSEQRQGSCWTNSLSVPREDVWRCMVNDQIFDPCYLADDGQTIVCGSVPGREGAGFGLQLTEPLPEPDVPADAPASGYMLELADRTQCVFASGATLVFDGKRLNYQCLGPSQDEMVVVIGDLQAGEVWKAEKAILDHNEEGFFIRESEWVEIRTVWQ